MLRAVYVKEQQMLWNAALKEIGRGLKYELEPETDAPDRLRELITQLEINASPNCQRVVEDQ